MNDQDHVLAANRAFYAAFATGDIAAMERLWTDGDKISCIHPGWMPVIGRLDVMASWRAVLTRPPKVIPEEERITLYGDAALVLCHERIGPAALAASNLFARTADGWKMIHHQAGPMARHEQPPAARLH